MKFVLIFILLFLPLLTLAQDHGILEKSVNGITAEELQILVRTLASDAFEGRDTGQKGQKLAAAYLKEQFVAMGLTGPSPVGDPFYQEFSLSRSGFQDLLVIHGSDSLFSGREFALVGNCPVMDTTTEIVFVGYGIVEEHWNDYPEDLDVSGKIVAFLTGEPQDKDGKYILSDSYLPSYTDRGKTKTNTALEKGALAAIRIAPNQEEVDKLIQMLQRFRSGMQLSLPDNQAQSENYYGVIHIGLQSAEQLLQLKPGQILKDRSRLERGKPATPYSVPVRVRLSGEKASVSTENVVALLRGSEIPDEYVVITAHYDHLGVRDTAIYNGADDNATGTAALIEIAEAFVQMELEGHSPKRSILFMPVSGEERGLLGSRYYVKNPLFPIEKTRAALNMDMIGRTDKKHEDHPNYVYVYLSDDKGSLLDQANQKGSSVINHVLIPEIKYKSDGDFSIRGSDHASFENVLVPVLYYYCGLHNDYHKPTDTAEKIEYEKTEAIARMVFVAAWELANL